MSESLERARKHFERLLELGLVDFMDKAYEEAEIDDIEIRVLHGSHPVYEPFPSKDSEDLYADLFCHAVRTISAEKWELHWWD